MNLWIKPILLIFLAAPEVLGCSCEEDEDYDYSDFEYVISAERVSKNGFLSFSERKYTFKISSLYQGKPTEKIAVWTNKSTPACGVKFKKGIKYILLVYKSENKLYVNNCTAWEKEGYRKYLTEKLEKEYANKSIKKDAASGAFY